MEQKINADLQNLISCICRSPNPQDINKLATLSNRIFNSLIGFQTIDSVQVLKQKCLERASTIYSGDTKTILKCQQLVHKVLNSRSLVNKPEAFVLLTKLSQDASKNNSSIYVDNAFKSQALKKQLDTTTTTFVPEVNRSKEIPEQLAIIRTRGSPEQGASEDEILREVIFSMQNIQGNLMTSGGDFQVLKPGLNVSEPVRKIVRELSDFGWLYKKITAGNFEAGEVWDSFSVALKQEMNEYYRWVALIQNMLKAGDLTLRKLVLWSFQPMERLKWLAVFCEAARPFKGTKIISIINSYRPHGSPHIMDLLNRILLQVIQPLFKFIQMWIYRGQLFDNHQEFFIDHNESIGSNGFWLQKYKLIEDNVPNVMGMYNAKLVFDIGKTINFMRQCCGHEFQIDLDFIEVDLILDHRCCANSFSSKFTEWLNTCQSIVNRELMSVLYTKFKLKGHLDAIKRFLLIGQGDFIQVLMESLSEQLSKPPPIYRHNLIPILQGALRASNAQFLDKGIIGRVNVKEIQGSDSWDSFSLDYDVDEPINTLLTPTILSRYLVIFSFLWKLKRVQRALNNVFLNHMKQISRKQKSQTKETEAGRKIKNYQMKFQSLFYQCSNTRYAMQNFINNLYSYVILTIEAAWNSFMESLDTVSNFDQILKLHEELVSQLTEICFLNPRAKNVQASLVVLFQQVFNFKHRQDTLLDSYQNFKEMAREVAISEKYMAKMDSQNRGQVKMPYSFNQANITDLISDSNKKISQTKQYFTKVLKQFIFLIEKEGEKYSILSFRLDFNEYYRMMPYTVASGSNKRI